MGRTQAASLAVKKRKSSVLWAKMNKTTWKNVIIRLFIYAILIEIAFIIIFPLITKLSASLMSVADKYDRTVRLIPRNPTLDNIKTAFKESYYLISLQNTLMVSTVAAFVQTLICACTGYGLAKLKSKASKWVFALVVLTILIPPQVILVPMYLKFRFFDIFGLSTLLTGQTIPMMNTLGPILLLSFTGFAFKNGLYIFIMRQFYKGIPEEIEEAAAIDGYGIIQTYFRIVIPMSIPMMITIFMFAFSWQWTDTFYSGMFFSNFKVLANTIFTMPSAFSSGSFAINFTTTTMLHTGVLLAIAPLIVIYIVAQRWIIGGIERSGLVG